MIKPWVRIVALGIFVLWSTACKVESLEIRTINSKGQLPNEKGYTITSSDGSILCIEIGWDRIPIMTWVSRR